MLSLVTCASPRAYKTSPGLAHRIAAICGLALALLLALPNLTAETGATVTQTPTTSALDELTVIRSNIELIAQLRRQGVEVDADGAIANRLLNDASRLTNGRVHSLDTLQAATSTVPSVQIPCAKRIAASCPPAR